MTFATARERLVAIVETAVPSSTPKGLASKFKHDPRGQQGEVTGSRRFWFRSVEGAGVAPSSLSINRVDVAVELVIDYVQADDAAAFDAAIVDDWRVMSAALGNQALWLCSTSGIISLGHGDDNRLFRFVVEDVVGGRRLRIRFNLMLKVL